MPRVGTTRHPIARLLDVAGPVTTKLRFLAKDRDAARVGRIRGERLGLSLEQTRALAADDVTPGPRDTKDEWETLCKFPPDIREGRAGDTRNGRLLRSEFHPELIIQEGDVVRRLVETN
jgi:hypothetical protein